MNNKINITITDSFGKVYTCAPYNYKKYDGVIFKKTLPIDISGNKLDKEFKKNEIEIFLIITPKIAVDRPPFVISKKRRVIELWQIKSFRSFNKREIWSHPSVTGYIDTKNLLNPTLSRNDFKNDKNFKLVCKAILYIEDEILETFKTAVKSDTISDYSEIESGFNSKLDSLTEFSSNSKPKTGDIVKIAEVGDALHDVRFPDSEGNTEGEFNGRGGKGKGKGNSNKPKTSEDSKILKMTISKEYIENTYSNNSRLILKIDDVSEPIKDSEGREKRSELFGNTIKVYKKHQDFIKRVRKDKLDAEYITVELISYLSTQMLIHYTSFSFHQPQNQKSSDNKEVLTYFTDSLYRLEDSLKHLVGKPLSK